MGRLDDAAKRKVVELREAGLSFRKIKAVLELENIKVSAQAIYLFLKEFQSKPASEQVGGGSTMAAPMSVDGSAIAGHSGSWSDQPRWPMIREAPRGSGYGPPVDSTSHVGTPLAVTGIPPGPSVTGGSSGTAVQAGREAGKDEEEIQIVSVTSLARVGQQRALQASGMGVGLAAAAGIRRRVSLTPGSSPTLAARRRLLDKALMHKTRIRETVLQSEQQETSLYRKDPACLLSSDTRKLTVLPQPPSFSLNSPRPPLVRNRFGGQPPSGVGRRMFQQRAGVSVRSMHPPLQRDPSCPAVRVANPVPSPPSAQAAVRSQPALQEPAPGSGLQEQVQTLPLELRSLGMAVRLLAEQQGRLEREQAQQTQVLRQILSALQGIASRMLPGKQSPCNRTPPPPGPPTYTQVPFEPAPSSYAQPKTCESDGLSQDPLDAYKLAGLSPRGANGFQACGGSEGFPAGHTSTQPQVHMRTLTYTQGQKPTFSQSYVEMQGQAPEDRSQGCGPPPRPSSGPPPRPSSGPASPPPVDPQLNIIKVETL